MRDNKYNKVDWCLNFIEEYKDLDSDNVILILCLNKVDLIDINKKK